MAYKRSKSHAILAAGAGVAVVTFQGVFMSGCGSVNPCLVKGPDGGFIDTCTYDAGTDADASIDASKDGASDAATDASSDAAEDAPSDAPSGG